ncbi:hypothetical protein M8J77_007477 [Diaphorina citri]|nr:hypothetical protein M8J77_007477 [Diaphorina citri]
MNTGFPRSPPHPYDYDYGYYYDVEPYSYPYEDHQGTSRGMIRNVRDTPNPVTVSRLWNALPVSARNSTTFGSFKTMAVEYIKSMSGI